MRARGFTLVELIVSMGLMGLAIAAIGSVLVTGLRTYSRQIERAQVRANLRTAMATLTRELRGLDAGGRAGSDIAEMERSSITYRATRSTYFLCVQPTPSELTVTAWADPRASLRQMEAGRDSVLLFAENDVTDPADNVWLSAGLNSVSTGAFCPEGKSGLRIAVSGVSESELGGVFRGAVVRGFQMTKILLYSDAQNQAWIGMRELRPGAGWTITQPILGPVAHGGLRFGYFGADGGAAKGPGTVARISIEVVGVGYLPVGAGAAPVRDSLTFHVGLRNNPDF